MAFDYKVLLVAVVFLGTFAYISSQFTTEFMTNTATSDYTSIYNGTLYSNLTSGTTQGVILQPPTCTAGYVVLDGIIGCVTNYMGYYWNLMTFRSDIAWLNILFLVPILAVLGYLILNFIIRIGRLLKPFG